MEKNQCIDEVLSFTIKNSEGANIMIAYCTNDRRFEWVENKISNEKLSLVCKHLAWIFGTGSRPFL